MEQLEQQPKPEDKQSRLKLLIAKGKEQGFLTYHEVNDHLPDDIVDPEHTGKVRRRKFLRALQTNTDMRNLLLKSYGLETLLHKERVESICLEMDVDHDEEFTPVEMVNFAKRLNNM